MIQLQLALIGHLYDRNQIDPQAVVALLYGTVDKLALDPKNEAVCQLIMCQINWLDRIGTGLKHEERRGADGHELSER
jgi:hypothetical protein